MNCETRVESGITIFRIDGDIVFNSLNEIRETIKSDIAGADTDKFAIDLSGVEIIDSAGVGFIVSVYKSVLSQKGSFGLISPTEPVKNVLQAVGLTRLFKVFESLGEAVEGL